MYRQHGQSPRGCNQPRKSTLCSKSSEESSQALSRFIAKLNQAVDEINAAGGDTGRLLTIYNVKLESVKKIEKSDFVVGVDSTAGGGEPLLVPKPVDPNLTFPFREKEVLERIGDYVEDLKHKAQYVFRALVWKYKLKDRKDLCWVSDYGGLIKYSQKVIEFIGDLEKAQFDIALKAYKKHLANRRKKDD